jgi:chromosome segregation ATPase
MTNDEICKELRSRITRQIVCSKAATLIEQQVQIIADNEKTLEDFKADFTKKYERQAKDLESCRALIEQQATTIKGYEQFIKEKAKELAEAEGRINFGVKCNDDLQEQVEKQAKEIEELKNATPSLTTKWSRRFDMKLKHSAPKTRS